MEKISGFVFFKFQLDEIGLYSIFLLYDMVVFQFGFDIRLLEVKLMLKWFFNERMIEGLLVLEKFCFIVLVFIIDDLLMIWVKQKSKGF